MNSPRITAVVGTSTESPRPKAPLTPAMATTIATAMSPPTNLRLLLRHMPLHRHARLETGGHHDLVVVHRPQGHRARLSPIAVHHAHGKAALLTGDRVARHDDR